MPTSDIVLWLFVLNLGVAFGAGVYEARVVVPLPRRATGKPAAAAERGRGHRRTSALAYC